MAGCGPRANPSRWRGPISYGIRIASGSTRRRPSGRGSRSGWCPSPRTTPVPGRSIRNGRAWRRPRHHALARYAQEPADPSSCGSSAEPLVPWPRLFQNLRASRETELAERFPLRVVTDWLGNSPNVAMAHYLSTTEDHFQRAAKSGAVALQNPVQQETAPDRTGPQDTPEVLVGCEFMRDGAGRYEDMQDPQTDPEGIRTPVAAVKGLCPRPLDDGATPSCRRHWDDRRRAGGRQVEARPRRDAAVTSPPPKATCNSS